MQLTTNKSFAPTTLSEAISFSEMLAASTMIPKQFQGKAEDVLVCVQWGLEIGLAPLQALQNIAVINGKPSIYGDAAIALVQSSSVCEDVEEYFEGEGTTNPIAVCVARRKGRKAVTVKFGIEDAKRAGLWGKSGPWSAYPKRMMQMRARGFALRDAFPDVLRGLITSEEAQDFVESELPAPVAKPANPLDLIAPSKVVIPEQTNDPMVIEEAFRQDDEVEEAVMVAKPEVQASQPEIVVKQFALFVPNKDTPHAYFDTLEAWQDGYEDIADKTAQAGKRPARERMTILRELKEANEGTLKAIDTVVRARHTIAYTKRIKALGAAQ
jgi:hypothetical protein